MRQISKGLEGIRDWTSCIRVKLLDVYILSTIEKVDKLRSDKLDVESAVVFH